MAAETSSMPVNGNYAPHQGYGAVDQQQNNYAYAPATTNSIAAAPVSSQTPPTGPANTAQDSDISKDEVGWYFVEQYYTTLSRSPEKLYLFYNKRSQFVSGQETDKVAVCVGQRAINDRIKELDFQDCKVRVTNVDSQASDSNIVIQVIGEISNKSQPHRKFTQTFVLATQTNGYFVLNDIFRYLIDEEDEPEVDVAPVVEESTHAPEPAGESQASEPTTQDVEPKTLTSSMDPIAVERDAELVDEGLKEEILKEQAAPEAEDTTVNGSAPVEPEAEPAEEPPSPAAPIEETPAPVDIPVAGNENLKPEQPRAPEPTPSETPAKAASPSPPAAPKPAAPKTWASLAASANKVATPVAVTPTPSSTSSGKPPSSTPKPSATAAAVPPAAPPVSTASIPQDAPSAPAAQRDESPAAGSQGDEWTAVGGSHNRQHSRQVNQQPQQEQPTNRGYIKNVSNNVNPDELRAALDRIAEVTYFDVAPERNCAFVDFRSPEAFQTAVGAGTFEVNGERLFVERRYTKNSGYGQRGNFQNNRGRGGMNQGGPRGGFNNRGGFRGEFRGGGNRGGAPRGRGAGSSQAV